MNDTANKPAEQRNFVKWALEKDFVTDTGSRLTLRLERHVEKVPTQYRWSFGALIPQQDNTVKFILGVRPWIERRGGKVTLRDETAVMLMLVQSMQDYVKAKEQTAEDEFQKRRRDNPRSGSGEPKGIKQWGKHDKEKREREAAQKQEESAPHGTEENTGPTT